MPEDDPGFDSTHAWAEPATRPPDTRRGAGLRAPLGHARVLGRAGLIGVAVVLVAHAAALVGLWQYRAPPATAAPAPLFVNLVEITPAKPPPVPPPPRRPPPPPRAEVVQPPPPRLVAEAPVVEADAYVAPPPPPEPPSPAPPVAAVAPPRVAAVAPAPAPPAGPVELGGELALACPERVAPRYPPHSRRLGEEGTVVLRVELDEQGGVSAARVQHGSGFSRLDEAALVAVRGWRCQPAKRDGRSVRAVAVQPFKFVLQGS